MEDQEKKALIEWFENIENEIEGVSTALFHQLRSAYPKEDFLKEIKPSGKNPSRFPEGCERIRNMAVDEFFRGIEGEEFSKPDIASTLYLFWELKILCTRKRLETQKNLTYQDAVEILKSLIEDLSPLLLNIGRFDEMMHHKETVTGKGSKTRKRKTEEKAAHIRSEAEKCWAETPQGYVMPFKKWERIVERALDKEDIGVTDKTLRDYRDRVEDLLEEDSKTGKIILKRKK